MQIADTDGVSSAISGSMQIANDDLASEMQHAIPDG